MNDFPVIKTNCLTKLYGQFRAVDNISITINQGEIYGFLGLNGAGKSTLIRMLLDMTKPTEGTYQLFNKEVPVNQSLWNDIGYMVESPHSYPSLTVNENLKIITYLRGMPGKSIKEITEKLGLKPYEEVKVKNLSLGNQQRLELAKALIHRPALLILDEPVNGLDPGGIVEIRNLLNTLARNGTTIFLSSHILSEIARLATRIGIIDQGRLVKEVYTNNLEQELIQKLIIVTNNNREAYQILTSNGYQIARDQNNNLEVFGEKAMQNPEMLSKLLVEKACPPKQVYQYTEDLEHYFLRTIGKV